MKEQHECVCYSFIAKSCKTIKNMHKVIMIKYLLKFKNILPPVEPDLYWAWIRRIVYGSERV